VARVSDAISATCLTDASPDHSTPAMVPASNNVQTDQSLTMPHSDRSEFMRDWRAMSFQEINEYFDDFGKKVRGGDLPKALGIEKRHYLMGLGYGVKEALLCGYGRLAVVEFGVFYGAGLLDLCRSAKLFRDEFGLDIQIYGFDRGGGAGLPALVGDYRDHPELFRAGEFKMPDQEALRAKLPEFCELVIGEVGETILGFEPRLDDRVLVFASYDLDLYSSTVRALPFLTFQPERYLPAVPMYFDDNAKTITQCEWVGEELAIHEFNAAQAMRKIERKDRSRWWVPNLFVLHVLDHPMRQGGAIRPRFNLGIHPM
jgi:hypothetical protein